MHVLEVIRKMLHRCTLLNVGPQEHVRAPVRAKEAPIGVDVLWQRIQQLEVATPLLLLFKVR